MSHDNPALQYKPIITLTKISTIQFPVENRQKFLITTTIFIIIFILAVIKAQETISTVHLLPEHVKIEQFDRFLLYASIITVLNVFIFYYNNSATIFALLEKLNNFDETLHEQLKVPSSIHGNAKRINLLLVAFFSLIITVYIGRIFVFYFIYNSLQFHTITYTIVYYLQYTVTLHYTFFLSQLHFRFGLLNKCLSDFHETNYILTKRRLRLVKTVHEHLCGVAKAIDGAFGVYQAYVILFSCIEQVMDWFFLFLLLKEKREAVIFQADAFDILLDWFTKMNFQVFLVFAFAHRVEKEVCILSHFS